MANNDDNNLLPTFVTSAPVVYNRGGAVHITGLSLLHDGGRTLFENADVTLNHGSIVGLVGTNGAGKNKTLLLCVFHDFSSRSLYSLKISLFNLSSTGKTSLARIISSRQLNGFPSNLVVEYLAASDDEEYLASVAHNNNDASYTLSLNPTDYIEHRVQLRTEQLSNQIQELESKLDGDSDLQQEDLERISDQLATMYDLEEDLKERVQREVHHAFDQLGLRRYQDKTFEELSSGWRFKCRLVAAFLTHPDLFIIDEPSFLDEESTEWFVTRTKEAALTDSAMVLLISHKEALLETLCDTILYINSANKTLTTYHCGYEIFRSTHDDQVESAHKKIMGTEKKQQSADKSLQKIQKELRGKERNLKATTTDNADQRFIKGKNKEAKQKADKICSGQSEAAQEEGGRT